MQNYKKKLRLLLENAKKEIKKAIIEFLYHHLSERFE